MLLRSKLFVELLVFVRFCIFSVDLSLNLTCFQLLVLGSKVVSTADRFYLLLIQHNEDLNAMRAEQAGAIANRGLMSTQEHALQMVSTLN